ncbi:hypothetical protein GTW54_02685 [Streptomyces sp. SID5468]|nr:hypothetical protein [Streptomyces sp. SID5468]
MQGLDVLQRGQARLGEHRAQRREVDARTPGGCGVGDRLDDQVHHALGDVVRVHRRLVILCGVRLGVVLPR